MDIDELYEILPRPLKPLETGSDEDWLRVAEQMGTRLPIDYVYFISSYGTGRINDFVGVSNPFSGNRNMNLIWQMSAVLSGLRELREHHPAYYPYPLYFEPGGLLPWGASDDGDYYCWLTKGSPDKWPVVTVPRHADVEYFDMPMCLFLARAMKGQITSGAIPTYFRENPNFTSTSAA
jgi:hypothetical protein